MATLVVGLPESARVKKKKSKVKITLDQALLAMLFDSVQMLRWGLQKRKGARPKSAYKKLTEEKPEKDELLSFSTPEEYERWRKRKEERWQCQRSQPLMSR